MNARIETCYANDKSDPRNAVDETDDDKKEAIKKHAAGLFKDPETIEAAFSEIWHGTKLANYLPLGAAIETEDCAELGRLLMQPLRDYIFETAEEDHEKGIVCRYACQSDRFEEE